MSAIYRDKTIPSSYRKYCKTGKRFDTCNETIIALKDIGLRIHDKNSYVEIRSVGRYSIFIAVFKLAVIEFPN